MKYRPWFERKRRALSKRTHQTPEDRIEEGEEFATFEDLEGLDVDTLLRIASECDSNAEPDSCVPCRAFAILMERSDQEEYQQVAEAVEDYDTTLADGLTDIEETLGLAEALDVPLDPDNLLTGTTTEVPEPEETVVQRFAQQVNALNSLVQELLTGPPIPPPNVTIQELAALVVGAEKWVRMIDAQGLELADNQKAVKTEIERVISKVRRDG